MAAIIGREAVEFDPLDGNIVYIGGHGACYRSMNAGQNWQERNTGILFNPTVAVARSGSLSLSIGDEFVFRKTEGAFEWNIVYVEPTFFDQTKAFMRDIAFNRYNTSQVLIVGRKENDPGYLLFQPFVWRTTDAGDVWVKVALSSGFELGFGVLSLSWDLGSPGVVYATGGLTSFPDYYGSVWKSSDAGVSWPHRSDFNAHLFAISALGGVVYVGGTDYHAAVFKSMNGGATWSDVRIGLPGGSIVRSLSTDISNPNEVYAGTAHGVYKTINGGQYWEPRSNGITYQNIRSVIVHPVVKNVVYAGSNDGAGYGHFYRSTDAGDNWSEYGDGLAQSPLNDLTIDADNPNTIYAATGQGVYYIPHSWTGELATSVTWRSGEIYIVEGRLTVPEGKTLTIEPGATVSFFPGASLYVYGALQAVGEQDAGIVFAGRSSDFWHGIVIRNPSASQLKYCNISHAQYGVVFLTDELTEHGVLENCLVSNCEIGVYFYGPFQYSQERIIQNNFVTQCEYGIAFYGRTSELGPWLQDNRVEYSSTGIEVYDTRPVLTRNRVQWNDAVGVMCRYNGNPELGLNRTGAPPGENSIIENGDAGYYTQLHVEYSSPFLGLIDESNLDCVLLAGGMNRVFHSSDNIRRIYAKGSSSLVLADKNFWGWPVLDSWFEEVNRARIVRRCPLETDPAPEGQLLASANAHRTQGEYDDAITLYKNIIQFYPNTPEAAMAMAILADVYADYIRATGDTTLQQEKLDYLQDQAANNPDDDVKLQAKLQLARDYEMQQAWTAARELYMECLQEATDPTLQAILYRALVNIYASGLSDIDEARAILSQMASAFPGSDNVHITRLDLALFTGEMVPRQGLSKGSSRTAANQMPTRFDLAQNFPNPFNPTTEIWFKLGADGFIMLKVYDVLGRVVKTLAEGDYKEGYYSVTLNATDLASGVYFYRLQTSDFVSVKKLLVLK